MVHETLRRRGTVLIIVAGVSAILAAMTLAFLVRMRSDSEESLALTRQVQARLMLTAGLNYIQETARMGWEKESFGWIDVRDGGVGPRDENGVRLFTAAADGTGTAFPAIGSAARCPAYVMKRPPYAISMRVVDNPMSLDTALTWTQMLSNPNPSPQPAVIDPAEFTNGDRSPRFNGESWFRIYRSAISTFVITCGAGPTQGYRDWSEVVADGQEDLFVSDQDFNDMRLNEALLYFEVEWNPAVCASQLNHNTNGLGRGTYQLNLLSSNKNQMQVCDTARQFGGTFLYIERLRYPPADW